MVVITTIIMNDAKRTQQKVLHLADFWPYQVTVLADRIARRTSSIVKESGINLSQWRVMAAIAEMPGRTSVEVVAITPMDKGIVSRATRSLLEHGFVRREASQEDGRVSHLYLTERGREVYGEIMPQVEAVLRCADDTLTREQQLRLSSDLGTLMSSIPDNR